MPENPYQSPESEQLPRCVQRKRGMTPLTSGLTMGLLAVAATVVLDLFPFVPLGLKPIFVALVVFVIFFGYGFLYGKFGP